MAEYITKEKAKELVCDFCQWAGTANCEECEHPVDDVSAADIAPVVHGTWQFVRKRLARGGYVDASKCSVCEKRIMPHLKPNYCPNCGAKMDGDGDV